MDAIKTKSLSYSFKQNISQNTKNFKKSPENQLAFSASLPAKEGVGKKILGHALSGIDKFQKLVEKGFVYEFLVVDFAGMIVPRTYQAYHRNEKELGHPNYAAAKEEFTREILSGPSMFLIPLAFLAASKKMFGPASHVKLNTLKKFKEVSHEAVNKAGSLSKNFYKELVERLYGKNINNKEKNSLVVKFLRLHNSNPKEAKEIKASLSEALISTNKKIGNKPNLGLSMADSSSINFNGLSKNVGEFVEECRNYSSDVINLLSAEAKNSRAGMIDKIHDFKEGARKLTTTTAIATLSAFLYFVPRLYQQSKNYPGLDGLTNKAESKENQIKTKEVKK